MSCAVVSPEGLICTMDAHLGTKHRDQTDPATEIEWHESPPLTLAALVADVDRTVHARAGALLAQAQGARPSLEILDEAPALVAPVRPPGVLDGVLRQIFPGRRPSPGARRTGTP